MKNSLLIVFLIGLLILIIIKNINPESFKNCPVKIDYKCRPSFTPRFYIHFIKNWMPNINNKKLDFYLKSSYFEKVIFENVKNIWRKANMNFDIQEIYYENANDNLSYYYPNDINRSMEFDSITFNLKNANPIHHKSIISDSLISLTDPNNRQKEGFHIYFVPYVGQKSIAKTIFIDKYPITFIGLYTEDSYTNNIKRTFDIIPKFQDNMDISRVIAKHIGYQFGLKYSEKENNLMNTLIHDSFIEKVNVFVKSNDIEKIKELLETNFNSLSKQVIQDIFSNSIKFTQYSHIQNIHNKKTSHIGLYNSCKGSTKNKLVTILENNDDLYRILNKQLALLFHIHFINEELNLDKSLFNNKQVLLLQKLKNQNNIDEFKITIENIFDRIQLKHFCIILAQMLNNKSLNIDEKQLDKARENAYTNKSKLHDYYNTKDHYHVSIPKNIKDYNYKIMSKYSEVIGSKTPLIKNVYKSECINMRNPCKNFKCLSNIYVMRDKNYKMAKYNLPISKEEKEEIDTFVKKNKKFKCEKKPTYMETLDRSFI